MHGTQISRPSSLMGSEALFRVQGLGFWVEAYNLASFRRSNLVVPRLSGECQPAPHEGTGARSAPEAPNDSKPTTIN